MGKKVALICLLTACIFIDISEAKGGRGGGGGRSGGRSSSRSSGSSRGSFSSSSGHSSSHFSGGRGSYSGRSGGGWYHGFFHSTPYHYTYRPRTTYTSSPYAHHSTSEESSPDTGFVLGYGISRALNSDFLSIFNVVHDISKYPNKIRNKEFTTTTTTTTTEKIMPIDDTYIPIYSVDPKSYFLDDNTINEMMMSTITKKHEEANSNTNKEILGEINYLSSSIGVN